MLLVAHCDFVPLPETFRRAGDTIESTRLDDRLGVYTVLDLLPSLGVKADVLLSDGEESMRSTAGDFEPSKEYNWIAEFDRRGDGVVLYQYDFPGIETYFRVDQGTYSDIADMGHLGVQACNVGIGYYGEHWHDCWMHIPTYLTQINAFVRMWHALHATKLPFVDYRSGWGRGGASILAADELDWDQRAAWKCLSCKELVDTGRFSPEMCPQCGGDEFILAADTEQALLPWGCADCGAEFSVKSSQSQRWCPTCGGRDVYELEDYR